MAKRAKSVSVLRLDAESHRAQHTARGLSGAQARARLTSAARRRRTWARGRSLDGAVSAQHKHRREGRRSGRQRNAPARMVTPLMPEAAGDRQIPRRVPKVAARRSAFTFLTLFFTPGTANELWQSSHRTFN